MFRALLRLIVIVVVLVGLGAFFTGYRWADLDERADRPVGTSGAGQEADTSRARERGAAIGERVATGANQAQRAMASASLTSKIKAKMALDDSVRAGTINVDTDGSVVTLRGTVRTEEERSRAVRLARETEGVTSVVDRLSVGGH